VPRFLLALDDAGDAAMRSVPAIEVPPNFITIRATERAVLPLLELQTCGGC
jgi:hypothetical protein